MLLVEIASGLLNVTVVLKTIPLSVAWKKLSLLKAVQHQKFHGDMFHVVCESIFAAFVLKMEVVGEEISFF